MSTLTVDEFIDLSRFLTDYLHGEEAFIDRFSGNPSVDRAYLEQDRLLIDKLRAKLLTLVEVGGD